MGFSTNVTISNDFWHDIKKDPERLVEYIGRAMNDGTNSPLREAIDVRHPSPGRDRYNYELRYGGPQGVVVHQARHNDEAQVIVNTYGSRAVAANEIPHAIDLGWLKLNEYNRTHAESVLKELEYLTRRLKKALKDAE
jgi:hypothetical protein